MNGCWYKCSISTTLGGCNSKMAPQPEVLVGIQVAAAAILSYELHPSDLGTLLTHMAADTLSKTETLQQTQSCAGVTTFAPVCCHLAEHADAYLAGEWPEAIMGADGAQTPHEAQHAVLG